ncbi:MAG: hypothetical protein IIA87_01855 [Nanoarchaeota archaeon]|nr:hypothetical protein [Nanoarchaeota archaeon]
MREEEILERAGRVIREYVKGHQRELRSKYGNDQFYIFITEEYEIIDHGKDLRTVHDRGYRRAKRGTQPMIIHGTVDDLINPGKNPRRRESLFSIEGVMK